jgi:RNA polymerase sigma-70 factor (ECF subfamily)
MAVCLRYLSDREATEDVLQDCFVKILTSIGRFEYRGEGSLKAWVTRVAANESLNYLRQHERIELVEEIPDEMEEEEPDVGNVPLELLQRMIEELPVGYRAVFNLYVFEQMSHKQIAKVLGIKESTSASQYFRAKKLLARRIRNYINQQSK